MFQVAGYFLSPRSFFRGVDRWAGLERATADYVGMLATVMNAICLQVWIVVASVSMMCWVDKSWVGMLATVMNAICLQVRVNRMCWLVLLARLCKFEGGACRSLWSAAGTPALPRSAACRRRSHAALLCRCRPAVLLLCCCICCHAQHSCQPGCGLLPMCSLLWRRWGCRRGCRRRLRCGKLRSHTSGEVGSALSSLPTTVMPIRISRSHTCAHLGLFWLLPTALTDWLLPVHLCPALGQAARDPPPGARPRRHLWRRHRQPILHNRHGGGAARGGNQRRRLLQGHQGAGWWRCY